MTATLTAPAATRGLVEITGVRKSFGATEVLKGVSLTVEPGGVAVIVGPSGSGKSTLLRTINHLEKVDGGHITIDGQLVGYQIRGDRLHELREKDILKQRTEIGMVFQNFNLFPHLTALENVAEAPVVAQGRSREDARRRGLELLDRVGLKDRADAYPRQLSGGQQFRATSPQSGVSVSAKALIEARLPSTSVARSQNPALASLYESGLGSEQQLLASGGIHSTGKLLVSAQHQLVGTDGEPSPTLFGIGPGTSGWGAGAFARPNTNAAPFRENDALARSILGVARDVAARPSETMAPEPAAVGKN